MTAYHDEFRPQDFQDVVGHSAAKKSLRHIIKEKLSNTFLFSGEAGIGKTTMARIVAHMCGAVTGIIEVDGATNSGIDNMREIAEAARFSLNGLPRAIIVDECHRLSPQAWDSLLKITEEPGAKLFWFFCTSMPNKVPKTIMTRAAAFALKPLGKSDLLDVLDDVIKAAKLKVDRDVVDMCAQYAGGSARQALTNLAKCEALTPDEAEELLVGGSETKTVIELCRFLLDGKGTWKQAMTFVADLGDASPEGTRIVVSNYMGKVLRGAGDRDAFRLITMLEFWSTPFNTNEGITPLLMAIGRSLTKGN